MISRMVRAYIAALGLLSASCASAPEFVDLELPAGASTGRIPIEAFFSTPQMENAKLSPNGRYVAFIRSINGYRNLAKIDLETGRTTPITTYQNDYLFDFWWANDERILLSCEFKGGYFRKLFAVDSDGTDFLDFAVRRNLREELPQSAINPYGKEVQYGDLLVSLLPKDRENVLVAYPYGVRRDWIASDVYKLNVYTGRTVAIAHSSDNPFLWFANDDGEVRIGAGSALGKSFFVYRESRDGNWTRVVVPLETTLARSTFTALGISDDPKNIYVRSRHESDRFGLYLYDFRQGQFSPAVFSHPKADVEGPLVYAQARDATSSKVIGIEYFDGFDRIHWLDPEWQAVAMKLDAALPNTVNTIVSRSQDDLRMIVFARSDRDPGTYYLYDRAKDQLLALSKVLPELKPTAMAEVREISFKTRDGLELSGYLALPPGYDGERVPVIVNPHGGTQAARGRYKVTDEVLFLSSRAGQSFDPELQFFTSRGWAVFRPNARGSIGLGLALQTGGDGEWGRAMQNDVTDGTRWLIESGIADPERICIYGQEYGGYASVEGLIQTPALFACGASQDGIFDLDQFLAERELYIDFDVLSTQIGDRRKDAERLRATSPSRRAAMIEDPVFLAHRSEDRDIRPAQSVTMSKALTAAGKPHHFLMLDDSEGVPREQVRLRFYRNLEAFFHAHLGGGGGEASVSAAP